jgi:3-oxosteroid 1-dehydrogenase
MSAPAAAQSSMDTRKCFDGSVIGGLYAAGNCTASLCGPHYIGAGQSIGASSVFGHVAAKAAAQ